MDIATIEQKLLEDRKYWQGIADYMIASAMLDPSSNMTYDAAMRRLAALDHALKRIQAGTFGRCEDCDAPIETERMELLYDRNLRCVRCAAAIQARSTYRRGRFKKLLTE